MFYANLENSAFCFNVVSDNNILSNESLDCLKGVVPRKAQAGYVKHYLSIVWS